MQTLITCVLPKTLSHTHFRRASGAAERWKGRDYDGGDYGGMILTKTPDKSVGVRTGGDCNSGDCGGGGGGGSGRDGGGGGGRGGG